MAGKNQKILPHRSRVLRAHAQQDIDIRLINR